MNTDWLAALVLRIPLILLFAGGYVAYRMAAVNGLAEIFMLRMLERAKGHVRLLILYIIVAAAVMSAFIPNAVAVLTMLPLLKRLDAEFREIGTDGMTTVLMVSAIYGAGIGGMATMIGSPANAILLVALDFFAVPGRENINFLNWMAWSLPAVVMLVCAAWFTAGWLGVPRSAVERGLPQLSRGVSVAMTAKQHIAARFFAFYLCWWIAEACVQMVFPAAQMVRVVGDCLFSLYFVGAVFCGLGLKDGPLLSVRDVLSGVPRRGLLFIGVLLGVFGVARAFGLDVRVSEFMGEALQILPLSGWWTFLLTLLAVVFLTEIMSNTVVVAGFFSIVHLVAMAHGMSPLPLMVGVSVASTCAFMTPVATPSNALAFGEMRNASLKTMLYLGAILNLLAAGILTSWLNVILPIIYGT